MDPEEIGTVALLSIRPPYVQKILEGTKRVEFRKACFGRPVTHAIIYATHPIKKIVGAFEVGRIVVASPRRLWAKYDSVAGIARRDFSEYFARSPLAVAIAIENLRVLPIPLELQELSGDLCPPQSYRYVTSVQYRRVAQYAIASVGSTRGPAGAGRWSAGRPSDEPRTRGERSVVRHIPAS